MEIRDFVHTKNVRNKCSHGSWTCICLHYIYSNASPNSYSTYRISLLNLSIDIYSKMMGSIGDNQVKM